MKAFKAFFSSSGIGTVRVKKTVVSIYFRNETQAIAKL